MPARLPRTMRAALLLAAAAAITGCQGKKPSAPAPQGPTRRVTAVAAPGAVSVTTRNTARIGGANVAVDAASIARVVYPGLTAETEPPAIVIVNQHDWAAALAASELAAAPLNAPLLYSEGGRLPAVSREALTAMHPQGEPPLGGAQVIEVASRAPIPARYQSRTVPAAEPAVMAQQLEELLAVAVGTPKSVIVVPEQAPQSLQMPAASLAAESGAPILFSSARGLPAATTAVLQKLHHPSIYVVDPGYAGTTALGELARLGRVSRIGGEGQAKGTATTSTSATATTGAGAAAGEAGADAAEGEAAANAVAVARYTDGTFGWGIKEPGHGLVFANADRPLDAPAAALLAATGDYAPLLLLESPTTIPSSLAAYLGDIQPAYTTSPEYEAVRGVYNHGWLIGNEKAIAGVAQAELDSLLEITLSKQTVTEESEQEP